MNATIKIGISTCLLGEPVRYNGGHKHDRFLTGTLGRFVKYVAVCPEVECGLPIPRETMHLVGYADNPRLLTRKTKIDHTKQMKTWAKKRVRELEKEDLCGFIFKSKSPSCGLHKVKIHSEKGMPGRVGTGLWAKAFTDHFLLIPVEEEGRLNDPRIRENFIEQILNGGI